MPPSVLKAYFNRIGSIAGSIYSSISSTKTGLPFLTAAPISLRKFRIPNLS